MSNYKRWIKNGKNAVDKVPESGVKYTQTNAENKPPFAFGISFFAKFPEIWDFLIPPRAENGGFDTGRGIISMKKFFLVFVIIAAICAKSHQFCAAAVQSSPPQIKIPGAQ